jgi:hypothetical protein
MAIDPMTMMMIAQGVGKGLQTGSRLFQPKFQNSRYGRLLKKRQDQGNLTPGQEMNVLGRTATTATKQANLANKRYMGSMINKGLQGSVSAQRGLREAEADVRRTVADTGKDIYESEEQAKSKAKLDYARAMDQDKAERTQAGLGVLSAGLQTAGQYFGAKAQQQQATDQSYMDAINTYGKAYETKTPSGQKMYTGAVNPKSGGYNTPISVQNEIDAYKQKAQYKSTLNTSDVENAIGEYQQSGDANMLFAKLLESGLSQGDALTILESMNREEKKNNQLRLPGVGL